MADITVPQVGESITEVFIGTWLKQEGDSVEVDEPLVEVETDKATLEIPATVSGVLASILKQEGDSAGIGDVIAQITEGAGATRQTKKAEASLGASATAPATPEETPAIMPAAQRVIDENKLNAADITGTGKDGRILKEDVQAYIESSSQPAAKSAEPAKAESPVKAPAQTPVVGARAEDVVPMSPLRRTIARRLVEAQQTAALLTTFNEIDMSAVMNLRKEYKDLFEKRYGIRLGFMSFFIKASVDALKLVPEINAEVRDNSIVYKNYYDVAVAVSGKKGLVTPVIRNTERMSFAEIEQAVADYGQRAQSNRLTPDELMGGTFTISNGGVFGSLMSTPIVNPPQSGVLGMHTIQQRPIALNGEVVIRPMMYVALSYDHRVVDGRGAVTFLKRIKDTIENPARMLIEV